MEKEAEAEGHEVEEAMICIFKEIEELKTKKLLKVR